MKSPRCESSSSPTGVSRLIGSLAIFSTLRTFSSGMASFSASSSGVGSRPISCSIWREVRTILLIVSIMCTGNADGARLVGDRAGDRLPDPPRRIGRELVAAAVLELVHRLHQADIAFLDQIEELQAAVGVFLGDGNDEAQIGLDHFLLGDRRLALALLDLVHDLAELGDRDRRSRWRGSGSRRGARGSFPSRCWLNSFQPRADRLEIDFIQFGIELGALVLAAGTPRGARRSFRPGAAACPRSAPAAC